MGVFLFLFYLISIVLADQSISEGPQDSYVVLGRTAVLKCKIEHLKGTVQWMKNGFGLGTDRELKFFSRYSITGDEESGEYNLQIINTTISDDDYYACQVSEAANEAAVVSRPAKLSVLMRPLAPTIQKLTNKNLLSAIAGETVTRSCVSRRGIPPAKVGWAISSDAQGKNIVAWLGESRSKFGHLFTNLGLSQLSLSAEIDEEIQKDDTTFSIMSNISFIPRPDDDQRYLVCLSNHETYSKKTETDSIKLSLAYAPQVNLTVASIHRLKEGGAALLACNVDAKPLEDLKISWFKSSEKPLDVSTDTLVIETLEMEDHNAEYVCQASNAIGTMRSSIRLNVSFGPRIMTTQQTKEVNEGETVSFRCEAIGNPAPEIKWTKSGSSEVIGEGELLVFERVKIWQQGDYICTASVEGFKSSTQTNSLHLRGAPVISLPSRVLAHPDETVEMVCKISGRPLPAEVKWSKNGKEISFSSGRVQVHQIPRSFGIESRLSISKIQESDYGIYNCSANNGLGIDKKGVILRDRNIIDILIAGFDKLFAVFVLGTLLLLLILCCLTCKRRCVGKNKRKKFFDDHDQPDVTVRCETIDSTQYYPELYNTPLMDGNYLASMDYIPIPQNNPDTDFMNHHVDSLYPKYLNSSIADYGTNKRLEHLHAGSFASRVSTPGGISEAYGVQQLEKPPVLESLPELGTPKLSVGNYLISNDQRPISRTSTHV